jgi:hypothetical protein
MLMHPYSAYLDERERIDYRKVLLGGGEDGVDAI